MKFGLLEIGASFEFEGETYVKTSPMIGSNQKNQQQKFFRRAAEIDCCDDSAEATPVAQIHSLSKTDVTEAFAKFYSHCEQCLQDLSPSLEAQHIQRMRKQLESAKNDFLTKICAV